MYKLYDMNERKLLDKSMNEEDIINTLTEYMKYYLNFKYKIVYHDEETNQDIPYKKITTVGQYYDYVNEYNDKKSTEELRRIKQMSCTELKKEILELSDKPRARIKRK